jgi:hypothetical protein
LSRTNISIDSSTADALSEEASKENKTMFGFANESLSAVLKICEEGGNPREVYPSWRFARMSKDVESIPLPGDLVEKILKKLYAVDKEWLHKVWFEEGARLGSYLSMYAPKLEELSAEVGELQGFLPVRRIELRKTHERNVTIRAIGAGLSLESTSCAEQLIRGVISGYKLRVVSSHISEGMIDIVAVEEERG